MNVWSIQSYAVAEHASKIIWTHMEPISFTLLVIIIGGVLLSALAVGAVITFVIYYTVKHSDLDQSAAASVATYSLRVQPYPSSSDDSFEKFETEIELEPANGKFDRFLNAWETFMQPWRLSPVYSNEASKQASSKKTVQPM